MLQYYIKLSLLINFEVIFFCYFFVMLIYELCGQVREELKDRWVKSFYVDIEIEVVRYLIFILEYDFQYLVIICIY